MCADSEEEKIEWIKHLINLIKKQNLPKGFNYADSTDKDDSDLSKNPNSDGFWVILHDWSQCTLACGGGKSYLQRMCVPPKGKGKPCKGLAVLEKICNTCPCPKYIVEDQNIIYQRPIMKFIKLSERPLRSEICVIKESEMLINLENDLNIPVRVIMNNQTLSIFTQDNYNNIYNSYDLKYLNVEIDSEKCLKIFDIRDLSKNNKLCVLYPRNKDQTIKEYLYEWLEDINTFKNKCKPNLMHIIINHN